jgi:hypothetical protein
MKRHMFCLVSALTMALVTQAIGQETPLASNFLYNYYTQPGASQVTAGMYPAPYWSPLLGAQSQYTYQPLMPHEHLYEHRRTYYQYYGGPGAFYQDDSGRAYPGGYGLNKTTVVWQNGKSHVGPSPFSWNCLQKLGYGIAGRHYCLGDSCGAGGCAGGNCSGGSSCGGGDCK